MLPRSEPPPPDQSTHAAQSEVVWVPPINQISQVWVPQHHLLSPAAAAVANTSYFAADPPRISDLKVSLPHPLAADLELVSNDLRQFDTSSTSRIQSFVPLLLRSEALSSSQIEHVDASSRQVFAASIGESNRHNATLIAAAGVTIEQAVHSDSDLDADWLSALNRTLLQSQPHLGPGMLRTEPIWVGTSNVSPHDAEFVAPPHEQVPELLNDLVAYLRRRDTPPLAHALIAHAQFETIHPFNDGNGRTGRALIQALLRHRAITPTTVIPVSSGLLADVDAYFAALSEYRQGNAAPLLRVGIAAADLGLTAARSLVADLEAVQQHQSERITARAHSRIWEVQQFSLAHPVFHPATAAAVLGITPNNLQRHLDRLVEVGILQRSASQQRARGKVYRNDEVLAVADRLSSHLPRRAATQAQR